MHSDGFCLGVCQLEIAGNPNLHAVCRVGDRVNDVGNRGRHG